MVHDTRGTHQRKRKHFNMIWQMGHGMASLRAAGPGDQLLRPRVPDRHRPRQPPRRGDPGQPLLLRFFLDKARCMDRENCRCFSFFGREGGNPGERKRSICSVELQSSVSAARHGVEELFVFMRTGGGGFESDLGKSSVLPVRTRNENASNLKGRSLQE